MYLWTYFFSAHFSISQENRKLFREGGWPSWVYSLTFEGNAVALRIRWVLKFFFKEGQVQVSERYYLSNQIPLIF